VANLKREDGEGLEGGVVPKALETLMYHLLETELGGVKVYEKAIECAINDGLRSEWREYLEHTREHVEKVKELFEAMSLDPDADGPGRNLIRMAGESLLERMDAAQGEGDADAAQIAACECVVEAETKDHMNWELLGQVAKSLKNDLGRKLLEIQQEVEEEEDEHLYHTKGWTRELWLEGLGLPTELPPPEEKKDVRTAGAAERAQKSSISRRQKPKTRTAGNRRLSRSRSRR
jgi:hypothetical protein